MDCYIVFLYFFIFLNILFLDCLCYTDMLWDLHIESMLIFCNNNNIASRYSFSASAGMQ